MSDWIPKNKKEELAARIEKIQSLRNQLEEEEIEKVKPLFKKHLVEQFDKPITERTLFQDEWGGTIMYLKFPKEVKKLKKNTSDTYLIYPISPTLESTIKAFIPEVEGIWEKEAIIRGKVTTQYKTIGSNEYPMALSKFLKTYDGAEKLDDIDPSDYLISYVINIWQGLAVMN